MQAKKSDADTGHFFPDPLASAKQTLDIATHLAGGKSIPHKALRYSTTAGEYGRYLSLIRIDGVTTTKAGNEATAAGATDGHNHDSPEGSTQADISPNGLGWRRFTRLHSQIGMYRNSSFN